MKRIVLLIAVFSVLMPVVFSQEIKEFVNDYADIINPDEEQELNQILKQIYDSGVAQYSIVTVDSLEGRSIEDYSLELAQGHLGDTEKNNGLLLLVALEDRKYRFEVGRGIEYILNDAKVGRIGRYYLVPNFKNEEYGKGIAEASKSVRSILLGDNESVYYVTGEEPDSEEMVDMMIFILIMFWVVFLPILAIILSKRRFRNRYFNAAAGAVILFGGRGGGRGGGGFGGFGGGGFGGGGASGGW